MKRILFFLVCLSSGLTAQIIENTVDLGRAESFKGITLLDNGNLFLGGYSGDTTENLQATTLEWNSVTGALRETKFGDPGSSQWQSVTEVGGTQIAGGGIVSKVRGEFTQYQVATFRPDGSPWRIFETAAFMGANNMVLDIEPVGETHFAAAGFVTFNFDGEEFLVPVAMISRIAGTGRENYQLESWDGPTYGLGVFLKVEVEEDNTLHMLFEERNEEGKAAGYKIITYALESGDLLSFFEVEGFEALYDFDLAPDGGSWYVVGHEASLPTPEAKVARVDWDGEIIEEFTLDRRQGICKAVEVLDNGVYIVGDVITDDLTLSPFFWQLTSDLDEKCYDEINNQDGSISHVEDMVLTEDLIYFVGSKERAGVQESTIWSSGYCQTNHTIDAGVSDCPIEFSGKCFHLNCDLMASDLNLSLYDLSGQSVWSSLSEQSVWCFPEDLQGKVLAYCIKDTKGRLYSSGKVYISN
jgi:hypothetical protein